MFSAQILSVSIGVLIEGFVFFNYQILTTVIDVLPLPVQPSVVTVAKVKASGSRLLTDPVAELNELTEWRLSYPRLDGDIMAGGAGGGGCGRQEESGIGNISSQRCSLHSGNSHREHL